MIYDLNLAQGTLRLMPPLIWPEGHAYFVISEVVSLC